MTVNLRNGFEGGTKTGIGEGEVKGGVRGVCGRTGEGMGCISRRLVDSIRITARVLRLV